MAATPTSASTMMACPEPQMAVETEYLSALQNVTQWSYFRGDLALLYQTEDGEIGTLVFVEMTAE